MCSATGRTRVACELASSSVHYSKIRRVEVFFFFSKIAPEISENTTGRDTVGKNSNSNLIRHRAAQRRTHILALVHRRKTRVLAFEFRCFNLHEVVSHVSSRKLSKQLDAPLSAVNQLPFLTFPFGPRKKVSLIFFVKDEGSFLSLLLLRFSDRQPNEIFYVVFRRALADT